MIAAIAALKKLGLTALEPRGSALFDVRAVQDRIGAYLSCQTEPVELEFDVAVSGPDGPISCHFYGYASPTPVPLLVYFHGGGFIYGSAEGWGGLMRDLVRLAGIFVLNVDYRLAPEYAFPAGVIDAVAVINHAQRHAADWGADDSMVAAGGDSAGANLALVAEMLRRDCGELPLQFLLLFYGVFSGRTDTESWTRLGTGAYGLSQSQMEWIWETYLQEPGQRLDWRACPLIGDLSKLPPVHQAIGTLDPLLDDAYALKQKLDASGVPNSLVVYPGVNHGFIRFNNTVREAGRAVEDAAKALCAVLKR
ncbi:alpha/beta hydrolase [Tardiphaga sp. vice304]|uniref:alpha/beta hydrolase n=1 Tax=Tardiphaga sp. vice304 TaxID=2592817 RepID=UPI0011632750|nr:alpha/beta hydrolase [Tardiphaga sp. vice304]QDM25949.1 alpha/beta hydrolase [Tardiphaga sp. vice304]